MTHLVMVKVGDSSPIALDGDAITAIRRDLLRKLLDAQEVRADAAFDLGRLDGPDAELELARYYAALVDEAAVVDALYALAPPAVDPDTLDPELPSEPIEVQ